MTQLGSTKGSGSADGGMEAHEHGARLDDESLARGLFQKVGAAQLDLLRARAAREQHAEEYRLRLRAAALLLACLPVHPDSEAYRLKTLATIALREEDGDEASHAWAMAERALALDLHQHPAKDG